MAKEEQIKTSIDLTGEKSIAPLALT